MRLEAAGLVDRLSVALARRNTQAEGSSVDKQALRDGLRVSLSELGKARSAAAEKNRDIDESSLPDSVKQVLKMIRELKEQIAAKQAELEAVMADPGLDPETRRLRVEALHSELASLNAALASANGSLLKLTRELDLSDVQMQELSGLIMK